MSSHEGERPQQVDLFAAKTRWVSRLQALPQLPPHLSDSLSTVQRQLHELAKDDVLRSYFLLIAQPRIQQLIVLDQLKNDGSVDAQELESRRGEVFKSHPDAPLALEFVTTYLASENSSQPPLNDTNPSIHSEVLFERERSLVSEPIKQEIAEDRRISLSPDQRPTTPQGQRTRDKVLRALLEFQEKYPDRIVKLTDIAKEIGVVRERARQIYEELADQGYDLPQKRQGLGNYEIVDAKVKGLLQQGLSFEDIAERMGIAISGVFTSRRRLIKARAIQQEPSKYEALDPQIAELRNQGLGNQDIAERLGISVSAVTTRLSSILIPEGRAKPIRAKRRTEEQLLAFDEQVKNLREQGNTDMQIAEILGVHRYSVIYSVQRLLNRDEIPLKAQIKGKERRPEAVALDKKVRELKEQGLTRQQISEQLDIPRREINASVGRIIVQAKRQQRTPSIVPTSKRPHPVNENAAERRQRIQEKHLSLDQKVKQLREEGLTIQEMSTRLEIPYGRVVKSVGRLLKAGEVSKSRHYGKKLEQFDEQVLALRQQGLTTTEIVVQLEASRRRVETAVTRLLKAGKTESRKRRPTEEELYLRQQIKQSRQAGLTYQEMATQLGMSSRRVERKLSALLKSGEIERKSRRAKRSSITPEKDDEKSKKGKLSAIETKGGPDFSESTNRVWEIIESFDRRNVASEQVALTYERMYHEALPPQVTSKIPTLIDTYKKLLH